jgi:hypothetical protein
MSNLFKTIKRKASEMRFAIVNPENPTLNEYMILKNKLLIKVLGIEQVYEDLGTESFLVADTARREAKSKAHHAKEIKATIRSNKETRAAILGITVEQYEERYKPMRRR